MKYRIVLGAPLGLLLAACQSVGLFDPDPRRIEVNEVYSQTQCGTQGRESRLSLLPDRAAVQALGLGVEPEQLHAPGPYVLVEMGERRSGGYKLAVSRQADQLGSLVRLYATFISPPKSAMVTMALSSPCVLVALPQPAEAVELIDQAGTVRAEVKP